MISFRSLAASAALCLAMLPFSAAQGFAEPHVVASIKPVHALVAAVMEGVGKPNLIVGGAASPHAYALKPSQAQAMENADLIFWVGHELESFLEKPIETIGAHARSVELIDAEGLIKLPFREAGPFEAHDHDDHATEDTDHAQDDHDEMASEEHDHGRDGFDAHLWLDPLNAKVFVRVIGEALTKADPDNAATYAANVATTNERLDALIGEVNATLAPVHGSQFIVFHDAYQYFEKRFDMQAAGSVTVNPEVRASAERVAAIQDKVHDLNAVCAFSEPQFDGQLIDVVIEGTDARSAVLDPLGATLDDGPELYFDLIRNLGTSMRDCLQER
ncbi:ABC-type Zn2+ transport system, periplasmic component/surface adhesin [Hoeflea sp. IMCC20628]|uniref:zinc ABC transporter substrate-binding protein n=1 Tax=Hoeflea sp. IMCC20628 TaxID=1620421 RepID=UPI00063AAFF0|nr:zinc ABC transporter substrate-binding protein [Hoeflea sp. IMCC20628]AKI01370.1 ABC-type Zn2+ transport system, periplasmic component/surface adhesin [Hoeflea sp. IMCC20628]